MCYLRLLQWDLTCLSLKFIDHSSVVVGSWLKQHAVVSFEVHLNFFYQKKPFVLPFFLLGQSLPHFSVYVWDLLICRSWFNIFPFSTRKSFFLDYTFLLFLLRNLFSFYLFYWEGPFPFILFFISGAILFLSLIL